MKRAIPFEFLVLFLVCGIARGAEPIGPTSSIANLLDALSSESQWQGAVAVLATRPAEAVPAIPALTALLQNSRLPVADILRVFEKMGPAAAPAAPAIAAVLVRDPVAVARTLAAIGPLSREALQPALKDPRPEIQLWAHAALALQLLPPWDGAGGARDPASLRQARSSDAELRGHIDFITGEIGDPREAGPMSGPRSIPNGPLTFVAFRALAFLGVGGEGWPLFPELKRAIDAGRAPLRGLAYDLGRVAGEGPAAVAEIKAAIRSGDPVTAANAIQGVADFKVSHAVLDEVMPDIAAVLHQWPSKPYRENALQPHRRALELIARYGYATPDAVDGVAADMGRGETEFERLGENAVLALGPAGASAIPVLAARLGAAENRDQQQHLLEAFEAMGSAGRDAIPALANLIDTTDNDQVRELAIETVARIDPADPRARSALVGALDRSLASATKNGGPGTNAAGALARIEPVDADLARIAIRALRKAPSNVAPWGASLSSTRLGPASGTLGVDAMAARIFLGLSPAQSEVRSEVIALADEFPQRGDIQRLAIIALRQTGGIPDDFVARFSRELEVKMEPGRDYFFDPASNADWAFAGLAAMGGRAAPAVPLIISRIVSRTGISTSLSAARALVQIGMPAAASALPALNSEAAKVQAVEFYRSLLKLDPQSAAAGAGLDRIIATSGRNADVIQAHALLVSVDKDAARHRSALLAIMNAFNNADAAAAAAVLARDRGDPSARRQAIDRLFQLWSLSPSPSEAVATGLQAIDATDGEFEERLTGLARAAWQTQLDRPDQATPAYPACLLLARTLARKASRSPAAEDLLAELRRNYRYDVRAAAAPVSIAERPPPELEPALDANPPFRR